MPDTAAGAAARLDMGDTWRPRDSDLATLRRWVRMTTAPQRLVRRSRIVLLLADGHSSRQVARLLGVSRPTIALWKQRFADGGCDALTRDRPGRGRKKSVRSPLPSDT